MVGSGTLLLVLAMLFSGAAAPAAREQGPGQAGPRFHGTSSPLDPVTRQRMTGVSWHRGCPVGLDDLRLLR